MSTDQHHEIVVGGVPVRIVRRAIKNLHLGVYPPDGMVRVSAPLAVSDDAVRLAVVGRLGWIKRQREKFGAQPRQAKREFVSGETHYFLGRRHRLEVVPHQGAAHVVLRGRRTIVLHIRSDSTAAHRARVMQCWFRDRLNERIPALIEKWQTILGVSVSRWTLRRMKTRWGTCNPETRHILLNPELVSKQEALIEFVVAHELTHLRERRHNERFVALMDRHLPHWRRSRELLNESPLAHENWR